MDSYFDAFLSTQFFQRKNTLTQKRIEGWSQIFDQRMDSLLHSKMDETIKTFKENYVQSLVSSQSTKIGQTNNNHSFNF